ncbi:putative YkwD family protein [Salsuginibacillus halophilus]|uniref:Putative YkwD family protein n=1 Tax=Salsuginibacillus halophilus TaxID=517424 RepID=A0A2P8H8C2_9BACI|nr:CAP domain-containing protein [Salsuginibacillus halophilus]PSL42441.1 putative YkwD family protein [Salsuginibacillus halophilus]
MKKYITGIAVGVAATAVAHTAAAETEVEVHTVAPGENVWSIAESYDVSIDALDSFNGMWGNLEVIHPGETLHVPEESSQPEQADDETTGSEQAVNEQDTPAEDEASHEGADSEEAVNEQEEPQAAEPAEAPSEEEAGNSEVESSEMSAFEQEVVDLTNEERAAQGLAPLEPHNELANVAEIKSEDMRDNNYFSHDSPTYGSPFDMLETYGVNYRTAGENIAAGQRTPEEVVDGWMNSDGHRANILDESYTHIGIGHAEGGSYQHYWTQMFLAE